MEKYCNHCKNHLPENYKSKRCKDCSKEALVRWKTKNIDNFIKYITISANNNAKKRNINFNITEQEIIEIYNKQNGKCFYTNMDFDIKKSKYTPSLDRIDSKQGYCKENCNLVLAIINNMKNEFSHSEFIEAIYSVSDEFINKTMQNMQNNTTN